jgi:hypothetical protein
MAGNQDSDILALRAQLERLTVGMARCVVDDRLDMWRILFAQYLLIEAELNRRIPPVYQIKIIGDNFLSFSRLQ